MFRTQVRPCPTHHRERRVEVLCNLSQVASFAKDSSGIRRFSSFLLAVNEINNKSDGIADDLLPNTVLVSACQITAQWHG